MKALGPYVGRLFGEVIKAVGAAKCAVELFVEGTCFIDMPIFNGLKHPIMQFAKDLSLVLRAGPTMGVKSLTQVLEATSSFQSYGKGKVSKASEAE